MPLARARARPLLQWCDLRKHFIDERRSLIARSSGVFRIISVIILRRKTKR